MKLLNYTEYIKHVFLHSEHPELSIVSKVPSNLQNPVFLPYKWYPEVHGRTATTPKIEKV